MRDWYSWDPLLWGSTRCGCAQSSFPNRLTLILVGFCRSWRTLGSIALMSDFIRHESSSCFDSDGALRPAQRLGWIRKMLTRKTVPAPRSQVMATNSPGGVARHVRVQVQDSRHDWHLHASFSTAAQARVCAEQLDRNGVQTRVVECRSCPTAG